MKWNKWETLWSMQFSHFMILFWWLFSDFYHWFIFVCVTFVVVVSVAFFVFIILCDCTILGRWPQLPQLQTDFTRVTNHCTVRAILFLVRHFFFLFLRGALSLQYANSIALYDFLIHFWCALWLLVAANLQCHAHTFHVHVHVQMLCWLVKYIKYACACKQNQRTH